MASINKVILIGNLGKAGELKYSQVGLPYSTFSLAVNKYYKDESGEKHEKVTWVNVVAFGKIAESVNKFLTVGKQVYVEGELSIEKYTDKEGAERYATKIIARTIRILGKLDKDEESVADATAETASNEMPASEQGGQDEDAPF
jgi:single-strand DNA-binding protein